MGMLHAHVSAAQKKSRHVVFGGREVSVWVTNMCYTRCVFFNIERGRQCVMDKFIPLQVTYPPFSPLLSR